MKIKIFILLLVVIIVQANCLSSSFAFSIGEEREVGDKLLYSVRSSFNLIEDPDIVQYINKLGRSVLAVTGIQYFSYRFYVINNKAFNAFAAPSGLIFFYTGLISTMDNEDQLVAVMAHEIGHIVKRHLAARVEKGKFSSLASLGLAIAAMAVGGAGTPTLLAGALATGKSINLHFSRKHEEEADLLAYGWMKRLKRNPEAQAEMLESMRRIARYRSDQLPQYLLTHPNPEGRLHYIESLLDIDRDFNKKNSVKTDNFAFLRFKYRILAQVKDTQLFKISLQRIIAENNRANMPYIMAEYGLSQIARNENDHRESLRLIKNVMRAYPGKNILKADLGVIEMESGLYQEAEQSFKEALQTDNKDMYATFNLAKLLHLMGRIGEAEKYYRIVQYELPEYAQVYFELGKIVSEQNNEYLAQFYLGKYNLYEGELKLAELHLKNGMRGGNLPEKIARESEELLKKIKILQK